MAREDDPADEFVRFRINIQRGDGPDRRADVTVESVRQVSPDSSAHRTDVEVLLPDGETMVVEDVPVESEAFASWYFEVQRADLALRDRLGLAGEAEPDGDA